MILPYAKSQNHHYFDRMIRNSTFMGKVHLMLCMWSLAITEYLCFELGNNRFTHWVSLKLDCLTDKVCGCHKYCEYCEGDVDDDR